MYWGESEFTYREILGQSLAVARQLADPFGVQPGDRVALWLKNRPEFVPALFGPWGPVVANAAGVAPGQAVLDVACGTGAATMAAAVP